MRKTIVLSGDSHLVWCRKKYLMQMEEILGDADIYNCAAGGWTSRDLVAKLPFLSLLPADLFIVSIGTNDAAPWGSVPLEEYEVNLAQSAAIIGAQRVLFIPPPPIKPTIAFGGELVHESSLRIYHDALLRYASDLGSACLNTYQLLGEQIENIHDADGLHLNDQGYSLLFAGISHSGHFARKETK